MNRQEKMEMISERRFNTSIEAKKLAKEAGLNEQQTKEYLFDADSNAIWDGEADMPYRSPKPPNRPVATGQILTNANLMYSAEEFCKKYLANK